MLAVCEFFRVIRAGCGAQVNRKSIRAEDGGGDVPALRKHIRTDINPYVKAGAIVFPSPAACPASAFHHVNRVHQIIDLDAVSAFAEGDRVFHRKFGYGTVEGIEGDKLEVSFDKAGVKHLVASFVVAAESADDVPF